MSIYTSASSYIRPTKSFLPSNIEYDYFFDDWLTMWDALMGEREIKAQGERYLPKTKGMELNHQEGTKSYTAYKQRAVFPEFTAETALGMYGLFWQKLPQIKLNNKGEKWRKNATIDGKSLIEAYREMVYEIIFKGRYGVLVDIPSTYVKTEDIPQIVSYKAESIVNWGTTIYQGKILVNFVLLDESSYDVDDESLEYTNKQRWRLCGLHTKDANGRDLPNPEYYTIAGDGSANKSSLNFKYEYGDTALTYPSYKGKRLSYIPFIFVNVTDLDPAIQKPPLLKIATTCISAYRLDSDLKRGLFYTSEPTLFGSGVQNSADIAIGSTSIITVPDEKARLSYVEISGAGLDIMKQTEDDLKADAKNMGIQLTQKSSGDETGASVEKHITVQTSTLKSIATTTSQAILSVLNIINDWTSDMFGTVNVIPSQEFSSVTDSSDGYFKRAQMYEKGLISDEDFYQYCLQNDFTSFDTLAEWKTHLSARLTEVKKSQQEIVEFENKVKDANNNENNENQNKEDILDENPGNDVKSE